MSQPRRKKDKLPKDVRKLTDEQVIEKVFSKRVREALQEEVRKADEKDGKPK